jgi:comEA protein
MGKDEMKQKDMLIKSLKRCSLVIAGIFLLFAASSALAEEWSQRYTESLPDSSFAAIEITKNGKKIRYLPHHNHLGELDIYHLKGALGRIHQVKWIDPANFAKAKVHLEQHYLDYKQKRAKAFGLKSTVNINRASAKELMQLPHIGEKRAQNIIEYRKTHGDFKSVGELRRVPGIGPKIFKDVEGLVTVE